MAIARATFVPKFNNIMKKIILLQLAIMVAQAALAQSTNPLNYSGTMYAESMTILETPRYVSYEEHAIFSEQISLPMIEVTKVRMDFENNKLYIKDEENKIQVSGCKKYSESFGWVVVVYFQIVDGDKMELVWSEYGKPYIQQITKTDEGFKIYKFILSNKPVASSPEEAVMSLFGL